MGAASGDESDGENDAVVTIEDDDGSGDDGNGNDGNEHGGNEDGQNAGSEVVGDIPENEDVGGGNEPEGEPSPASPDPFPLSQVPAEVVQELSFAEAALQDSQLFGDEEEEYLPLPPLPPPAMDPLDEESEYDKFTPEDKALPFVPSESTPKLGGKNDESELRKLQDLVNNLKKERTALLLISHYPTLFELTLEMFGLLNLIIFCLYSIPYYTDPPKSFGESYQQKCGLVLLPSSTERHQPRLARKPHVSQSAMMRSSSADLNEVIHIEDSLPFGTDSMDTQVPEGPTESTGGFMEQFHEELPELKESMQDPVPLSHVLGINPAKLFQGSL